MKDAIVLAITSLFVVIGWFVLFKQAIAIKHRDEIRKLVDLCSVTIDEIYVLCKTYYSDVNGEHIGYNSTKLRAKFVLLSHYLLLLRRDGISDDIAATLTAYKIHATGGLFETTKFAEQNIVPNWKSELASSAEELRFRVEKGFFDWAKSQSKVTSFGSYTG